MSQATRVAVFLDRDGVINYNCDDYVKQWAEFHFLPGILIALKRLRASPLIVIVVTNQSAVGRGLLSTLDLEHIHIQMTQIIQAHGGRVDGVFYCPHHPEDGCACRKPKPGLLKQAAQAFNIDLTRSYLIGDAITDIQAALAVGCFPLLVLTGRGTVAKLALTPHHYDRCKVVPDLPAAVDWILRKD